MLSRDDVVTHLRRGDFLQGDAIPRDAHVEDVSRRNRNFKVTTARGSGYFLKQGDSIETRATVAHEADVYRYLSAPGRRRRIGRYLPSFYGYEAESGLLVTELLAGAENLAEHHGRRVRFSLVIARAIGDALGTLHGLRPTRVAATDGQAPFPSGSPPWVLSIHRPKLESLPGLSGANIELVKIIQRYPEFCDLLDELRRSWRNTAPTHGDIRWENLLVAPAGSRKRLKIVDWELAALSHPSLDTGSVFGEYLGHWVQSAPIGPGAPFERFASLARLPLESMKPAMRAFWDSYSARMGFGTSDHDAALVLAARFTAARLAQTAFELTQLANELSGHAVTLLQLSLNVMRQPEDAIDRLFGVELRR
jgi:hypothetical protein